MENQWKSKYTINNNNWDKYRKYSNWNNKKNYKYSCNRYSAGILPYTYDLSGNCLFLLGKDQDGLWSDFGGRSETKDNDDIHLTASREFYEETLGSVLSISECMNKLKSKENKITSKTLNGSPYYMFIIYIDYDDNYIESFHKTCNFMKYNFNHENYQINKFIEKNTIRWVNINTLLNCINSQNNSIFPLRNVFLKTLEYCKDQLIYFIK